MIRFLKEKIIHPFIDLLTQGITPEKLALSAALGFVIGIIPLVGVSTAICALLALLLDLNLAAIQIVNYIAYPLQILFYIPFIKAGEKLLAGQSSGLCIADVNRLFESGFINALKTIWHANLLGIFAWLIITVPVTLAFYRISLAIFRRFLRKKTIDE